MLYYQHREGRFTQLVWRKEPCDNEYMGVGYHLDTLQCDDCRAPIGRLFFTHECQPQIERLAQLAMQMIEQGIVK